MKKLLLLLCILGSVQILSAQDSRNGNQALSQENHALLSRLVMSDHNQAVNRQKSNPKAITQTEKKASTAKSASSFLSPGTSPNGKSLQNNVQVFVIKDSKSKVVKTKPLENKPITKKQTAALEAALGIKQ